MSRILKRSFTSELEKIRMQSRWGVIDEKESARILRIITYKAHLSDEPCGLSVEMSRFLFKLFNSPNRKVF